MPEETINRFDRERAVVQGGHWSRMEKLERGVWFVLIGQSNFNTGRVAMGMPAIARLAGIRNLQRAREACQSLETLGLVRTITQGGGRHEVSEREMLAPAPLVPLPWDDLPLLQGLETGPVSGPVSDAPAARNRAGERCKTGPVSGANRAGERCKTGPVSGPQSYISNTSPPPCPKTGPVNGSVSNEANGRQEEVVNVKRLTARGLWPQSAKALIERGLTAAAAEDVWRGVVNDRAVRDRAKVYYRRLRDALPHD